MKKDLIKLWRYSILLLFVLTMAISCLPTSTTTDSPTPAAAAEPAGKPAPAVTNPAAPAAKVTKAEPIPAPPIPAPKGVKAPAGTVLNVILLDALSSDANQPGDSFAATLAAPLVVDGTTVLEKGAKVQGRVVDAEEAGKVKGRASMRLALIGITHGGKVIPIVTKPYVVEAESTKKRDAEIIGGAAGIGAAIGAIAGGGKGALIGAGVGGGAGTGTVLATKGKKVEFKPESKLTFTLEKPVEIQVK